MFKSSVESPVDGTIESISQSTGRVVVREAPIPVEVDAYVRVLLMMLLKTKECVKV